VSNQSLSTPYVEKGSGPAVVFSHGTLMDKSMFDPQIDALADDYRVIAFDSRARTGPYNEPWKLRELADDTLRFLDELEIERCILAGMSVGAFMAIEFALTYLDRLDGLIVIDGMAQAYTPEEQEGFGHEFGNLDVDGLLPRSFAEWAAPFCFGEAAYRDTPELVEHWIEKWCALPARSVYREAFSWLDKADNSEKVASITVPTLLVHGADDLPVSIERARPMAAAMPNARLVEVPGAGHTSNLENPAFVNEAIRAFVDDVYGR
jgi:pimeloyl-ACP methyl ester carboxylesterase